MARAPIVTLCPDPKQTNGFSLLETLIVVTILAMVTTLGVANFSGTQSRLVLEQEAQSARRILADARLLALTSRAPVRVEVDPRTRIIGIEPTAKSKPSITEKHTIDDAVVVFLKNRPARTDQKIEFFFFPDGQSTGGTFSLVAGLRKRTITVDWLSGQSMIEKRSDRES